MKDAVYIKHHPHSAGKWIYEGYARAWLSLGFKVIFFNDILQVGKDAKFVMTTEADLGCGFEVLKNVEKSFVFVQPFKFAKPWGDHPNWVTSINHELAAKINELQNIKKWTFVNNVMSEDYKPWENVHYAPLAFDSLGYHLPDLDFEKKFDVCFVGGWADNGFNEKQKRIVDHLGLLEQSGIRCGFFVNSGLTHEQENIVICSSRVALNIHDEYQVRLGLDLNERTFKSLAMTGILVSDDVKEMKIMFPHVKTSSTPTEMLETVKNYLEFSDESLFNERLTNRNLILENHTYVNRVKELMNL